LARRLGPCSATGRAAAIQQTRPQTLAFGLADSPVGQLAWIAEKFHEWADAASTIAPERLLTNVMLYWLSGTAASSALLPAAPLTGPPTTLLRSATSTVRTQITREREAQWCRVRQRWPYHRRAGGRRRPLR